MRVILLIFFYTTLYNVYAQPVLTAANTNPQIGEAFHWFNGNNVSSPGNSGTNQVWNFSSLTASFPSTDTVILPSSALHGSDFPTSDFSFFDNASYDFFSANIDSLNYLGGGSLSWERIDSNPETYLIYPFSFNSTFTDNYINSFFNSGTLSWVVGSETVTCDGSGVLELPYGTFNDVLRIKRIENEAWTTNGVHSNITSTKYLWYLPGIHQPILILTYSSSTGSYMTEYLSEQTVGISEYKYLNAVSYFPNPFSNSMKIDFEKTVRNGIITIYNMQGQLVKELRNLSGLSFTILRSNLPAGIYYFQIMEADIVIATDKIIISY
jgi:hypothetical protein